MEKNFYGTPEQRKAFMNHVAGGILRELNKPQNRDLAFKVANHGLGDGGSFMDTFTTSEALSFDDYATLTHGFDAFLPTLDAMTGNVSEPDYRSMSERYDEYLAELNENKALNETQTE